MASEASSNLRLIDLQEAKARRARRGTGAEGEPTPTPRLDLDDRTRVGERPARPAERGPVPALLLVSAADPQSLGQSFPLDADEIVLGRSGDVGLALDDPGVSRRHARLVRRAGGGFLVEDLGSTNGTYVNGVAIRTAQLVEGDRIQMGTATELLFGVRREAAAEELRLRQAVSATGAGAFEWNVATGLLRVAGALATALGDPRSGEDGGPDAWRHVVPEDRAALAERLRRTAADGGKLEAECRLVLATGDVACVALAGMAFRDEAGRAVRITGTALDVTERKRAELELRRQALVFDALSDGVVGVGTDGAIAEWNGGAERLFGWGRADALGRRPGALLHPDREDALTDRLVACARGGARYTEELVLRQRGGGEVCAEVVAVPLRSPELGAVATVAVFRDVGERKRLQARLQLTERLAALGSLAAGVAHEINNPLTFVMANLEYVVAKLDELGERFGPERGEVDAALHDCQKGAHRIKQIVQDMRVCVVDRDAAPGAIDVGEPIDFALRMADRKLRQRATVRRALAEVPKVLFDEGRLGQVLLNLLVNAAEAIPPEHPDENEVVVATRYERAANRVVVEISDSGAGIAPADRARIFDPFFTTKPVGSGVGLGLSVCHGIVTSAGGEMGFRSTPGEGTTFWVSLPAAVDPPRRARVLVVDDEPDVGVALRRCLEPRFEVAAVSTGREALERIAAGERFTLIVVDVAMRDLSGPELVARLEEVAPEQAARAVLASGGYVVDGPDGLPEARRGAVLAKPFDLELVRDMVETALASEADGAA